MDSPGEIIRDARRRKGLSPEEVFRIARVRPGLLEKVEEDVLTALPEDPYARGLYASLARAVGADVDRVLAAYDRMRGARSVAAFREPPREPPRDESADRPAAIPRTPLLVTAAVLLAVVGLVWFGSHRGTGGGAGAPEESGAPAGGNAMPPASGGEGAGSETAAALDSFLLASEGAPLVAVRADTGAARNASADSAQAAGGPPAAEGAAETGEDMPPPPPTEAADGAEPVRDSLALKVTRVEGIVESAAPAGAPSATAGVSPASQGATVQPLDSDTPALPGVTVPERELVLEARAVRNTWMRVVIDDARTRAGILPGGETRSWRGRRELRLDIAAIENVRFRLNGRPVEIGEPRRGMAHFVLGWENP